MAVHVGAQRRARRGEGPAALVLAPTRELAIQIAVEAQKLLWGSRLFASVVYGGASARAQLAEVGPSCSPCLERIPRYHQLHPP